VCDIKHLHRVGTVGNVILAMCAAVGFGPDSYRDGPTGIFIESFLALAFNNSNHHYLTGWAATLFGGLWKREGRAA